MDDPQLTQGEVWLDGQRIAWDVQPSSCGCRHRSGARRPPYHRRANGRGKPATGADAPSPSAGRCHGSTICFPRLEERRKQEGVTLSGGEQQMLAIARALAREIKVLLLDEPYEGLAPVIVRRDRKDPDVLSSKQGMTTIIVEQNAVRALKLADRAVILDTGQMVFDGSAQDVLDNEALRAEYLAI